MQHDLNENQIKEKEKAVAQEEQEGLQNSVVDPTPVLVTQPLESMNVGLVSFIFDLYLKGSHLSVLRMFESLSASS